MTQRSRAREGGVPAGRPAAVDEPLPEALEMAVRDQPVDVLLVDDQPQNLTALQAILGDLGPNLVLAGSGAEALRHVLARDFAVILLDVQMPVMDGYETAELIRQRNRSRHTPIIFLTASHSSDAHTLRGYSLGAVDYLFKPLDAAALRSKVGVFVELAKKTALIERQTALVRQQAAEARQLADSRARLLLELEQKHRDLAEANRELETFSYSVSHDLRAPLRSIEGFSEALAEDHAAQLDANGVKYLGYVREAAQQMGALIDGLLELARLARSELRRGPVDLSRLAAATVARLRHQQPEPATAVVIADGLRADGDARLLAAMLDNLIGNAWKFTRRQPAPRIEIGATVRDGHAVFVVRDNGVGFDMAYADKLFAPFQRLHGAAEFDGHGIGLATVQRIVRRHGGRIWATGEVGAGATFYFTLADEEARSMPDAPETP